VAARRRADTLTAPARTSDTTPALAPNRPTIREKSAAEILANLKSTTPSHQFHKKAKELYIGLWTPEPGWQAIVHDLPGKLSGGGWSCLFKEVGTGIILSASTVQELSKLRPGDSVTVSGRISCVGRLDYLILEDAVVRGEHVPFITSEERAKG